MLIGLKLFISMKSKRPYNEQVCDEFRELLTKTFYGVDPDTGERLTDEMHQKALDSTKPWRNDVWKAFREIEDRLCPLKAVARDKERNNER